MTGRPTPPAVPFAEALRVWAHIGVASFGGPAGQIALMHRVLVDEKRWIGEARFLHALNYCMLLPGPEAQQLAIYVGWLLHRIPGGLAAGTLFVLPGSLVILALSALYAGFAEIGLVQGLFFGIKAAVLAIVVHALTRIARRALRNASLIALAAAAFVAIFFFDVPFPAIVLTALAGGLLGGRLRPDVFAARAGEPEAGTEEAPLLDRYLAAGGGAHTRPRLSRALVVAPVFLLLWVGPVAALHAALGPSDAFAQIGVFFSKMAVVTFGGAYAVLAYVAQEAVENFGWLSPREMLDGLGLAETTPGPLILVTEFVGFLAAFRNPGGLDPWIAGALGAALTVWVTFVPCFLWIFLGAPYVEALHGNRALVGALTAITAAVVGVVLNLAVWFALHVLFASVTETHLGTLRLFVPAPASLDVAALLLTIASFLVLFWLRIGILPLIGMAAAAGALYSLLAG